MTGASLLPAGMHVLERGWLSANNIVFSEGVVAVVDTGYWSHQAQTLALMKSVLGERALELILNTHLHSDHCGGNAALKQRYPAAMTLIPPGQSSHVARWDPVALTYEPTGQHCPRFTYDALLRDGTSIQLGDADWQVHAAAGHDPHSVILFEPRQRILLSADALWENGFGVVFPELEGADAFAEVSATLDLIENLAPRVVVPGHGSVFTDTDEALARARRRLQGFIEVPQKHARHAAKVLLKFKLLEAQSIALDGLLQWAMKTPYMNLMHRRHFNESPMTDWLTGLLHDLARSGAAELQGSTIANR